MIIYSGRCIEMFTWLPNFGRAPEEQMWFEGPSTLSVENPKLSVLPTSNGLWLVSNHVLRETERLVKRYYIQKWQLCKDANIECYTDIETGKCIARNDLGLL